MRTTADLVIECDLTAVSNQAFHRFHGQLYAQNSLPMVALQLMCCKARNEVLENGERCPENVNVVAESKPCRAKRLIVE